ncbi:helix-turn-helix domain-containing protein [Hymenobacter negativus]|uniref:Helix-turn-helix transcriptional regulator n=1 Tax=Hymenobacter negativus TaxID=2795026 RepID=A0ABS3QPK4_9BACT|nr:helix-turn-helix domain-containing protein [Hymenobacter negativus]MBO2012963.1 helix-turn-helix transcriptional regulator [Hymenobacter negativus]
MGNVAAMEMQAGQYMGQVPFSASMGGVILATSQHEFGAILPAHYHVNPHFTFVLEGRYEEAFAGQRVQCQRGDLLYHPAGCEHFNRFEHAGAACFNVEISPDFLLPGKGLRAMQQQRVLEAPQMKQLLRSILQEVTQPDCFSESVVVGTALQLTGLFMREQSPRLAESQAIRRVKALLNDASSQALSLLEMSQTAGMSASYLCREFKRATGLTLGEYARQQKVARVCQLLAHTRLTTEEIAFEVGFTDASYLTRVFKKVMGITPGDYRKML